MTQDEIIEIAKRFGITVELASHPAVKQLVNEVVKQTENRFMQLFLDPENQPTQFGTATQEYREKEIKDEREACAKFIEHDYVRQFERPWREDLSAAIRARGQS